MTFSQVRSYVKELIKSLGLTPVEELSSSDIQDLKDAFDASNSSVINPLTPGFTPIGTIISVMGNTAPPNYLICNGQTVNISDYPELANYFEQQFGTKNNFGGDGETTFAVPDLRGEFLRGTGTNSHENQGSGGTTGEHQDATILNQNVGYAHDLSVSNYDSRILSSQSYYEINNVNSGSKPQFSFRPTNTSVLYCIAVRNIYIEQIKSENIYSLDEKIIGQWIDGKPLYQKTLTGNTPSSSGDIQTGLTNIDNIFITNGYIKDGINNGYTVSYGYLGSINDYLFVDLRQDGSSLYFSLQGNRFQNRPFYITLQYTKTTD